MESLQNLFQINVTYIPGLDSDWDEDLYASGTSSPIASAIAVPLPSYDAIMSLEVAEHLPV